MRIAVFGLGEAGSAIAGDLVAAGAEVRGFDPATVATPAGVRRDPEPGMSVEDADLILSITAAADSQQAMEQALGSIRRDSLYADLATAAPALELELARKAAEHGVDFADVALMAPVPGAGLGTPALASGAGATRLASLLNPVGARITVMGSSAGDASARKLLRSIVTKGLAALLAEADEAGHAHGETEWLRGHLAQFLTELDGTMIERLIAGSSRHAGRRIEEMDAVRSFLTELGVEAHMVEGTMKRLRPFVSG